MKQAENLNYLKIFLLIVIIAAAVSVAYKIFLSFKKSTFKYQTFNLLIEGEESYVIRLNRELKKLYIVKFPGTNELVRSGRFQNSLRLGVALDGVVTLKNCCTDVSKNFMDFKMLSKILFKTEQIKLDNIDRVDVLKLFFYSSQVNQNDRIFEEYGRWDLAKEALLANLSYFYDQTIFNEKSSVQIINTTYKNGLGADVATALKSIGFNIVSVSSEKPRKKSEINFSSNSVSTRRLGDFLPFVVSQENTSAVADITIILGEDISTLIKN